MCPWVPQAQKHNRLVHFIGPRECRQHFFSLGVAFEEYAEYEEVYEWFLRNIGTPVYVHVSVLLPQLHLTTSSTSELRAGVSSPLPLCHASTRKAAPWGQRAGPSSAWSE